MDMSRRNTMLILVAVMAVLIALSLGAEYFFGSAHKAPSNAPLSMPNYKAALHIASSVPADQRDNLNTQFAAVQAALDATTTDFNAWVALGVVRKEAGDYQGAEQVWLYTAQRWPTLPVAFNNLGDLYMNYLKDYPKAESNYERLIQLDPTNINAYASLFELYHSFYKTGTSAAADILAQGLKANPGNQYLLSLKAQLEAGK